jgi:hypothetical protein
MRATGSTMMGLIAVIGTALSGSPAMMRFSGAFGRMYGAAAFAASNPSCGGRVTSPMLASMKSSGVMPAAFSCANLARRAPVFLLGVPFLRPLPGFYTRWPSIFPYFRLTRIRLQ